MRIRSLIPFLLMLAAPTLSLAVGLQDAASGMAKDAATSTAKDTMKSMTPKEVTGAADAAKGAAKSAEDAKKAAATAAGKKPAAEEKATDEPMEDEVIPAGEE